MSNPAENPPANIPHIPPSKEDKPELEAKLFDLISQTERALENFRQEQRLLKTDENYLELRKLLDNTKEESENHKNSGTLTKEKISELLERTEAIHDVLTKPLSEIDDNNHDSFTSAPLEPVAEPVAPPTQSPEPAQTPPAQEQQVETPEQKAAKIVDGLIPGSKFISKGKKYTIVRKDQSFYYYQDAAQQSTFGKPKDYMVGLFVNGATVLEAAPVEPASIDSSPFSTEKVLDIADSAQGAAEAQAQAAAALGVDLSAPLPHEATADTQLAREQIEASIAKTREAIMGYEKELEKIKSEMNFPDDVRKLIDEELSYLEGRLKSWRDDEDEEEAEKIRWIEIYKKKRESLEYHPLEYFTDIKMGVESLLKTVQNNNDPDDYTPEEKIERIKELEKQIDELKNVITALENVDQTLLEKQKELYEKINLSTEILNHGLSKLEAIPVDSTALQTPAKTTQETLEQIKEREAIEQVGKLKVDDILISTGLRYKITQTPKEKKPGNFDYEMVCLDGKNKGIGYGKSTKEMIEAFESGVTLSPTTPEKTAEEKAEEIVANLKQEDVVYDYEGDVYKVKKMADPKDPDSEFQLETDDWTSSNGTAGHTWKNTKGGLITDFRNGELSLTPIVDTKNETGDKTEEIKKQNIEKIEALKTENNKTRAEYLNLLNKKKNIKDEDKEKYEKELEEKKVAYDAAKKNITETLLEKGDEGKIEAHEFLLGEVELKRKNEIENGSIFGKMSERVKKGITWYENIGTDEKDKKVVRGIKKMTKMAVNVALIGGASAGVVAGAAVLGVGSAAAISGGILTYAGKKALSSVVMANAVSALPPTLQKWAAPIIMGATYAMSSAGGAMLVAGVAGYGASRLAGWGTKRWLSEEAIAKKRETANKKEINLEKLRELEAEYEKIEREANKKRMYRRLLLGAVALAVSVTSLELMGQNLDKAHDTNVTAHLNEKHTEATDQIHARVEAEKIQAAALLEKQEHEAEIVAQQHAATPDGVATPEGVVTQTGAEGQANHVEVATAVEIRPVSITVNHGHGAIGMIKVFGDELHKKYPDLEAKEVPQNVKDFLEKDPTKEAIELGFYKPNAGAESALIHEGSTLDLDAKGNISFHDPVTNETNILVAVDNTSEATLFEGKMIDTHRQDVIQHHEPVVNHLDSNNHDDSGREETIEKTSEQLTSEQIARNNVIEKFKGEETSLDQETIADRISENTNIPIAPINSDLHILEHEGWRGSHADSSTEGYSDNTNHTTGDLEHIIGNKIFRENFYDLKPEEVAQAYHAHTENIRHIFPGDKIADWNSFKTGAARDYLETESPNSNLNQISYVKELHNKTGIEPAGNLLDGYENVEHYEARALQFLISNHKLDSLNAFILSINSKK